MQAHRFDAFTKRVASAPSRRGVLRLLGGGLAGGLLATLRQHPTSAQPPPPVGSPTITSIRFVTPEPSQVGQPTTIAFAVMSAGVPLPLGATPTGTVTISAAADELSCTGTLAPFSPFFPGYAVGSCTITFTSPGVKQLTAFYSGNATFAPSSSVVSPWPHTVLCPGGQPPCGTPPTQACCAAGTSCVAGTCCPAAQVCGTPPTQTCCGAGTTCVAGSCCANLVCGTAPNQVCCPQPQICRAGSPQFGPCCTPTGSPCDIFNPGGCCSLCCRRVSDGPPPQFVCC